MLLFLLVLVSALQAEDYVDECDELFFDCEDTNMGGDRGIIVRGEGICDLRPECESSGKRCCDSG